MKTVTVVYTVYTIVYLLCSHFKDLSTIVRTARQQKIDIQSQPKNIVWHLDEIDATLQPGDR